MTRFLSVLSVTLKTLGAFFLVVSILPYVLATLLMYAVLVGPIIWASGLSWKKKSHLSLYDQ